MAITITLQHDPRVVQTLKDEWLDLHGRSAARGAALSWHWISIWYKHFHHLGELWLMEAREAGCLVGVAPLMRVHVQPKYDLPWWQIEFIGTSHHHEHLDFIIAEGYEQQVLPLFLDTLMQHKNQWDIITLAALSESETIPLLQASAYDWQINTRREMVEPYTKLPDTPEKWMQSLSRNRRWKLRHYRKKLDEEFPDNWSLHQVTEVSDLEDTLQHLVRLHQAKWEALDKPGAFHHGQWQDYYCDLMKCMLEQGWLRLYRMDIHDKPAAILFTYHYRGRAYNQIAGVDESLTEIPIGHVMTHHSIEQAIKDGVEEYSFMWGDEPYKYSFGGVDREQIALQYTRTARVRLHKQTATFLRDIKARVRNAAAETPVNTDDKE